MGREYWVQVGKTPVVYRYIDWSITVPLQMIEFNLILRAANKPTSSAGFWKLLIGTVIMLSFGYAGEIDVFPAPGRWQRQWLLRGCRNCLQQHAPDRHSWLVHLPSR